MSSEDRVHVSDPADPVDALMESALPEMLRLHASAAGVDPLASADIVAVIYADALPDGSVRFDPSVSGIALRSSAVATLAAEDPDAAERLRSHVPAYGFVDVMVDVRPGPLVFRSVMYVETDDAIGDA